MIADPGRYKTSHVTVGPSEVRSGDGANSLHIHLRPAIHYHACMTGMHEQACLSCMHDSVWRENLAFHAAA